MKAGIAGGGIMGQLMALALINAGFQVTLFDRDLMNNCSMSAAGLLMPIAELEKNDLLIYQLGMEALCQHWPNILSQLNSKIYFQQRGSLVLSHPRDHAELTQCIQHIANKLANNAWQMLNHQAISQLEPDVAAFNTGYYFPHEGQIDNQTLLTVLINHLLAKQVTWLKNSVTAIQPGLISADKNYHFDLVIDCRGLGAREIFSNLRSIRGELIWLNAPAVCITRPIRFLHPRYHLYIVPRPQQIYLIGASEIESNDASPISVRTTLELLTAAFCVNSKFSEARIIKTVTHCRPTLENHLPKIKYADGFVAINGLYRHGFLIAPTLMHEVLHWILQGKFLNYPQLWEKYAC